MLAAAVMFWQVILAVHIAAVVVTFGVIFAYPLLYQFVERADRKAIPGLHRAEKLVGRFLVNPGLLIVLLAGIYLASHLHLWKQVIAQWGIAAVVILGGLEGALAMPTAQKAGDRAAADLAAGGGEWSAEYLALRRRALIVRAVMAVIVLVTVYVMAVNSI